MRPSLPFHGRIALLSLVAVLACTTDDVELPPHEGDAQWVVGHFLGGDGDVLWAFDISEPNEVLSDRKLATGSTLNLLGDTPWGSLLVVHDGSSEQLRLDEAGYPEWAPLLPEEAPPILVDRRFTTDGRRMLATLTQASFDFHPQELWLLEFDQGGTPTASEHLGSGSVLIQVSLTPGQDAVLWNDTDAELYTPGPLRMSALEPESGPSGALTQVSIDEYSYFGDKLFMQVFDTVASERASLMLPLADLHADPVDGPVLSWSAHPEFSDDGRWICTQDNDQIALTAFTGMSFGDPTPAMPVDVIALYCDLRRPETLLYAVGTDADVHSLFMRDLSGPSLGDPVELLSSPDAPLAEGYRMSSDRERLIYVAQGIDESRLELVEFAAPGTKHVLTALAAPSYTLVQIVDDRRILFSGQAQGQPDSEIWLVDLGPELDPSAATSTRLDSEGPTFFDLAARTKLTPAGDEVVIPIQTG
ncbi:MAG: hypothetical protein KC457_29590, partial [Myxococcales bacterium]|nr:hypothetical protein [Myxococcales bacterium]